MCTIAIYVCLLCNCRIEECIKSLLEMTTELTGEQSFLHPVDAINHMSDNQLLEKMACYNPEPEQVNKLLKHVVCPLYQLVVSY